jgi:hypothetical protein
MDELFGAIGRLIGGVVGEGAGKAIVAGVVESAAGGDDDDDDDDADATYARYLAGAPRELNINDR